MGRLFSCFLMMLMLLPAPRQIEHVQPVFFSMLFPQLVPDVRPEAKAEVAVML